MSKVFTDPTPAPPLEREGSCYRLVNKPINGLFRVSLSAWHSPPILKGRGSSYRLVNKPINGLFRVSLSAWHSPPFEGRGRGGVCNLMGSPKGWKDYRQV